MIKEEKIYYNVQYIPFFIASYQVTSYHHPCNLLKMSKSFTNTKKSGIAAALF